MRISAKIELDSKCTCVLLIHLGLDWILFFYSFALDLGLHPCNWIRSVIIWVWIGFYSLITPLEKTIFVQVDLLITVWPPTTRCRFEIGKCRKLKNYVLKIVTISQKFEN